jgi:large subunit ribosomal protein L17
MLRGLVDSLVEHGRIRTTIAKAKELRRHVERAVTIGKGGDLHAQRLLLSRYPNPSTVSSIIKDVAPRFKTRPGGYTRIVRVGARPGDQAEMALIEWVDYELPAKADQEKEAQAGAAEKKKPARVASRTQQKKRKRLRVLQRASRAEARA